MAESNISDFSAYKRALEQLSLSLREQSSYGKGGGDGGGRMDERLGKLEVSMGRVETRLDGIDSSLTDIKGTLRRIEDKALTEWAVFKVVGAVMGLLLAVALFVLRVTGTITFP